MSMPFPPPPQARQLVRDLSESEIRAVANPVMDRTDVLAFWFGESDQPTPPFIRQAASQSIRDQETFYAQNMGRPWLRAAIASYLSQLHDRPIAGQRIAVTGSGVAALMLTAQLLLNPGDKVVAITPLWANLVEIPKILNATVQRVALRIDENRWTLDMDELLDALTPDTRLLVLNSPNNPTGWMLDQDSLRTILAHCRQHGIWILSDDVYERLVFDPALPSAPSLLKIAEEDDRLISTNSFSKAWNMTGWRVGWLVTPPMLVQDVCKLIEYNQTCVFDPVQRGALAAVTGGEAAIVALRQHLVQTRSALLDGLTRLPGVEAPEAGGAMYVFFRIDGYHDSRELATQLIEQVGLGLAPGTAFGPEGSGWLRWCHNVKEDKLRDGLQRLARFLAADH